MTENSNKSKKSFVIGCVCAGVALLTAVVGILYVADFISCGEKQEERTAEQEKTQDTEEIKRSMEEDNATKPPESEDEEKTVQEDEADMDVETEAAQIQEWYYTTQNNLNSLKKSGYPDGIACYFEEGNDYGVKLTVPSGYNDWHYNREYFYHDGKIYLALLSAGREEYRVYFKDNRVIRYIDPDGVVYDCGNTGAGEALGNMVLTESQQLYSGKADS